MPVPVVISEEKGNFVATVVANPDVRVVAPTREGALAEMQRVLDQCFAKGELVFLEVPRKGIMAIAGKYKDDETLVEICDEIYRARDAEPKE